MLLCVNSSKEDKKERKHTVQRILSQVSDSRCVLSDCYFCKMRLQRTKIHRHKKKYYISHQRAGKSMLFQNYVGKFYMSYYDVPYEKKMFGS
jgi:hypothetical protein